MKKKIVKVDIDGVIRNMTSAMCDIYNRDFNENVEPCDIVYYDVDMQFPRIRSELGIPAAEYFFKNNCKLVTYKLTRPYNGVQEALKKLHDAGFHVVIVTWQSSYEAKQQTLKFLNHFKIPYDDICFTRDKHIIKGDYIIDDNPEFLSNENETAKKIVISAPYNTSYTSAERYDTLLDAVNSII